MTSHKFRLEFFYQLQATREEQARAALARAVNARGFAEETLAAARAELHAHTQAYNQHRTGCGFQAASHARHWATLQNGQSRCQAFEGRVAECVDSESLARNALAKARRNYEMMLKLRNRHRESRRNEELRSEEQQLSDYFNASRARRNA